MSVTAPAKIVIASRESALALWQAGFIRQRLAELYPQTEIRILGMTTLGDQNLDTSLAKIGGKGLFVKELEQALEDGRADIAVHSMKDVPMNMPPGFMLAAIGEREDPRDAFVSRLHPSLEALGLADRITALLSLELSLPAVGQGALGIECLADRHDLMQLMQPLHHLETAQCVQAERAMSRALAGSCQVPLGGFAEIAGGMLRLRGFVASPDGTRMVSGELNGMPETGVTMGEQLAQYLKAQGAEEILAALESTGG